MKRLDCLVSLGLILFLSGLSFFGCEDSAAPVKDEPEPCSQLPYVVIDRPSSTGGEQTLAQIISFGWHSGTEIHPTGIRYFVIRFYNHNFDIIRDLNENPWRYEDLWSEWISWNAPGDSGLTTIIGDDEELYLTQSHIFAVQARDWCGNVTKEFIRDINVRQFRVTQVPGPLLIIGEPFLGAYKYHGIDVKPAKKDLPPDIPLNFMWRADAGSYNGEISSYRYGWDVSDPQKPGDWEVPPGPYTSAPEVKFYSGVHTFTVEAVDNVGLVTRGSIELTIIPWSMERNLLLVDDFYSINFNQIMYAMPTELEHDNFWKGICLKALGWDYSRDIYDCTEHGYQPPSMHEIGRYKNIIWVFDILATNCWTDIVYFTPEGWVGNPQNINYISLFLATGGHVWTCGRSDRSGGLAAILHPMAQTFPISFKCEITGINDGCEGDPSGVNCMGYKDYCVTMIDKVQGVFRSDPGMPLRTIDRDALRYAYIDETDAVNALYPGLPENLNLWEEVTRPGRFFDPTARGFFYVEVYDPEYWMSRKGEVSQDCFHPMYRMRSRSTLSPLDHSSVALWVTKYENIIPPVYSGVAVAAPSVHFGFPLWFFDRAQVDSIVDVVFNEWQIRTP